MSSTLRDPRRHAAALFDTMCECAAEDRNRAERTASQGSDSSRLRRVLNIRRVPARTPTAESRKNAPVLRVSPKHVADVIAFCMAMSA